MKQLQKRAEEPDEKLLSDLDDAFSVMGDGWEQDVVMCNMFDECVKAAKDFHLSEQEGLIEKVKEAILKGQKEMEYCILDGSDVDLLEDLINKAVRRSELLKQTITTAEAITEK